LLAGGVHRFLLYFGIFSFLFYPYSTREYPRCQGVFQEFPIFIDSSQFQP